MEHSRIMQVLVSSRQCVCYMTEYERQRPQIKVRNMDTNQVRHTQEIIIGYLIKPTFDMYINN